MGRTLAVHVADIGLIPASPAGVIFFFWPHLAILRSYFQLFTQELLLAGLGTL